ncbi:MAG: hypothetical protein MUF54_23610, partial [Polyangiaceae bacterium]|nr:hypothetical protein [Polyangiaceae bacterium]
PDRLTDLVRPVISAIVPAVVRQLREDRTPLGCWVPDGPRSAIERAVSRPNFVHEDWIRALFRQRAVEAVMADALYRGIRDFSTLMPRLMLSLMPVSRFSTLGSAGAFGKRVIEELEKRIEPEIKTFLQGGTKLALERAANFAVEHSDDEAALAFRRNVVHFVLSKAPAFHVHGLTPAFLRELEPVVEQIARHAATRGETRTLARDAITQVADTHGDKTVGQLLRELGVREQPPLREWAALAWPLVLAAWTSPAARMWVDGLVQELLEEHERLARRAGADEPR